ncbi:MAG: anti-sigma factor family protein, partial [Spirochaetota bacterium]
EETGEKGAFMNAHIPLTQLSEYLDGELSDEQRSVVSEHLAQCECCSCELAGLKKMRDAFHSVRETVIRCPEEFLRSTMKRVRRRRVYNLVRHYAMPASAAAVILVVVGVSFFDTAFPRAGAVAGAGIVSVQSPSARNPALLTAVDFEDNVDSDTRINDIVRILERNGAQITKIDADYVEADALMADYQNIRGEFDFTALPPTLAGRGMSLAGVSEGSDTRVRSADRQYHAVTFRIRRK